MSAEMRAHSQKVCVDHRSARAYYIHMIESVWLYAQLIRRGTDFDMKWKSNLRLQLSSCCKYGVNKCYSMVLNSCGGCRDRNAFPIFCHRLQFSLDCCLREYDEHGHSLTETCQCSLDNSRNGKSWKLLWLSSQKMYLPEIMLKCFIPILALACRGIASYSMLDEGQSCYVMAAAMPELKT